MLSADVQPLSKPIQLNTREAICLFILCLAAGALLSHMPDFLPSGVSLLPPAAVEEISVKATSRTPTQLIGITSSANSSLRVAHSNVASLVASHMTASSPSVSGTASASQAGNAANGEKIRQEIIQSSSPDDCLSKDLYDLVDSSESDAQPSPGPSSSDRNETGGHGSSNTTPTFGYVRLSGNDFASIPLNSRTCFTMTGRVTMAMILHFPI